MDLQNIWLSFLLTSLGGLTTVIGGLIAISGRKPGGRLLSLSMGFAAGIMLFVSFTEMLAESREHFERALSGDLPVEGATFLAFFGGMILVTVASALLPEEAHSHVHIHECGGHHATSLYRTGLITAVAISLHNLPEGLATFSATTAGLSLGLPLIIAVTLHNIPTLDRAAGLRGDRKEAAGGADQPAVGLCHGDRRRDRRAAARRRRKRSADGRADGRGRRHYGGRRAGRALPGRQRARQRALRALLADRGNDVYGGGDAVFGIKLFKKS